MNPSKADAVIIGELNIDLVFLDVPLPEFEKEKLAQDMRFTMGSSSAITAHNLSVLGARVGLIGKSGVDYFGSYMIEQLRSGGVDVSGIIRDSNLKTGATIVLSKNGRKALLTYMGAMTNLTAGDIDWNYIGRFRHLHLGCYYLQTGIKSQVPSVFARAQEMGLTTSLDTNWDPEERWGEEIYDVLKYTNIFFPNDAEALNITRTKNLDDAVNNLSSYVDILAIKCGREGSILSAGGEKHRVNGFSVNAIESTGAGDSFNAGFLSKYLKGEDLMQCVNFGNACGALAVTQPGGTGAYKDSKVVRSTIQSIMDGLIM